MNYFFEWYHVADPYVFIVVILASIALLIIYLELDGQLPSFLALYSAIFIIPIGTMSLTINEQNKLNNLNQKINDWVVDSDKSPLHPRPEIKKLLIVFSNKPENGLLKGFGHYNNAVTLPESLFLQNNEFLTFYQFRILNEFFDRCHFPINPLTLDVGLSGYPVTKEEADIAIKFVEFRTNGRNAECFSFSKTLSFLSKSGDRAIPD